MIVWVNLREEEEDENCAEDDQAQDEPASPIIPGGISAYSSVVSVVVTASHIVSRMFGRVRRCECESSGYVQYLWNAVKIRQAHKMRCANRLVNAMKQ